MRAALAVAIVAVPIVFIVGKMTLFQVSLAPLKQLAAAGTALPRPASARPQPAQLGIERRGPIHARQLGCQRGAPVRGAYRTGADSTPASRHVLTAPIFRPWPSWLPGHTWGPYGESDRWDPARLAANLSKYSHVWVMRYGPAGIWAEEAGAASPGSAQPPSGFLAHFLASFEDRVFLTSGDTRLNGETLTLTLNWLDFSKEHDLTVFRHVLDCQGNLLGQGATATSWDGPCLSAGCRRVQRCATCGPSR